MPEKHFEPRDAEALFDYSARSSKELSFKKGDVIRVFKRFNPDWWDGTINGTDGFVPAKYIRLPTDDDADITDGKEISPFPASCRRCLRFHPVMRIDRRTLMCLQGSLKERARSGGGIAFLRPHLSRRAP
ncbi:SLIT-ROBO Rho GTPase-activating protein 3 [Desmophyllum pertusum]|uniref:SLIT-ROBO Rho GTPase-activating protein 3 n=1 Tax=Desmophyllum pertusum TaxID=174260 RepID=A0A9W9YJL4_9CNID|nr:SLIT-ROBO Rho GTPase-activating protein 3 [Desmophyllum pertusum]